MKRTPYKITLAIIGTLTLFVTAAAQDQQPLALLKALPVQEAAGPGWKREIWYLFDAISKPAVIVDTRAELPDSYIGIKREALANPTNPVSARARARYEFKEETHTNHYEVQVERYRDKEGVLKAFNALSGANQKEYQMKHITRLGEAAILVSGAKGTTFQSEALCFRRGTFRISIRPLGGTDSWDNDMYFTILARVFDERLAAKLEENNAPQDGVNPQPGK